MTENKRFMVDDCGELMDLSNHKFVDYGDDVCELLNELWEENKQLKQRVSLLKDDVQYYKIKSGECEEELLHLRRDNEQLKSDRDYWRTLAESLAKKNGKGGF